MKVWTGDPRGWGPGPAGGTALTIGVFDGVHRGHRALLADLADRAAKAGKLETAVVTFDVHPRSVVTPERAPRMISTLPRRLEILEELGVDQVGVLPFGLIRNLSADRFVRRVIVDGFAARTVVVGRGFRFGAGRAGNVEVLRECGRRWGFVVEARRLVEGTDGPISSSSIRRYLAEGDVARAGRLLGRPHELQLAVAGPGWWETDQGAGAADLRVDAPPAIPAVGIYAVWVGLGKGSRPALCEVATPARSPQAGGLLRIHLLEPGDSAGGETSTVIRFVARLSDLSSPAKTRCRPGLVERYGPVARQVLV